MFGLGASKLDRGLDAFERREWKRARKLLEEAQQEDGRANGFYHLGVLYWRGLGGPTAGAGDREAMLQLATMCEPEEHRRWLLRASELGYAPAMLHLSDALMQREPVEALSWLYAAVTTSGDDAARKRAASLAREMSAAEIDEAQKAGRMYAKDIQQRAQGKR
jgi:TPR repeat protein